jgi:hypothetical protein
VLGRLLMVPRWPGSMQKVSIAQAEKFSEVLAQPEKFHERVPRPALAGLLCRRTSTFPEPWSARRASAANFEHQRRGLSSSQLVRATPQVFDVAPRAQE